MGLGGLNLRHASGSLGGSVPKTGSTASSTRRWVDNQAGWSHSISIKGRREPNGCRLGGAHSKIKGLDLSHVREEPLSGRIDPYPGPGSRERCRTLKRHTLESIDHTCKGKVSRRKVWRSDRTLFQSPAPVKSMPFNESVPYRVERRRRWRNSRM